ncbi:dynein regulatory complex subunit 3-like [Sitodiplosis mosellana]|uniref:dynein regulatory complex subunit 3-like n=1 Tax=Sitodiplosis mosellana TaxID=263140 RepID=UPI002443C844|nr:dynein regulatory complex subunit 3-like [Sitodiplosis mosellana]
MSVYEMTKVDQSTAIGGSGNADDDDKKASDTKHQHVVKKSSEPGVINDAMLKNLIRAHGPRGEAARLCRNIAIDYGTITELCLEYQNILKIDHIWMCFNLQKLSLKANKLTIIENLDNLTELRELDLSFNFIKTIKNLECLRKLQYLTLFQNDIRKIDNLDRLEHLVRLNLGNNFIETVEGIESLRYKEQLFSLNLEGNPICDKLTDNIDFRLYIAAYLPKLKYYGYQVITNAERDKGQEIYKNKLRMLEENESERSTQRHKQSLEVELLRISGASFVEDLDKHQLFESLFANSFDNIVLDTETSLNDTNKSDIQL